MNFLVISNQSPIDSTNGGDLRIWNLLSQGKADLWCFKKKIIGANGQKIIHEYPWQSLEVIDFDIPHIDHTTLVPQLFMLNKQSLLFILRQKLDNYFVKYPNTIVIAMGHNIGLILAKLLPRSFVFDGCDSMSLYFYRRHKLLKIQQCTKKINSAYMSKIYQAIETYIGRKSTLYLVTAEADKQWILKHCPKANLVAIGSGTKWLNEPPIKNCKSKQNTKPSIAFHGGMKWPPNRATSLYLIQEILPLLEQAHPAVSLRIAGGPIFEKLAAFGKIKGVEICGFVEDLREWLAECDVYVMPMLQGSGVKTKLIETMAAGLPIVTNSMGAEALPAEAKQGIVIADGKEAIANAVTFLLNNPDEREKLRVKARAMAEKYFSWDALSQQFMAEINKIHQIHQIH